METKKSKIFEKELQEWMKNTLNPYCLNECKILCCDCEGEVQINKGYEHLFKTYKLTGKKVPIKKENYRGPRLFKSKHDGLWYFSGGACPNFDPKNKKCLIHNKYPRCTLYPLMKTEKPDEGYMLFSICSLHKLKEDQEPLKSLIQLCHKHGFKLSKE
jgi:Fe-S-cluster containining protein